MSPGHLFAAALAVLCMTAPARAQAPFSAIDLQFHWTNDVSRSPLHQNWRPGRGAAIGIAMPFYKGDFELGGTIHRYSARSDVPGFAALLLYAGWGIHVSWREFVSLFGTARLGNYRMSFDGAEDTFAGVSTESELAVGVGGGLSWRVAGPVSVYGRLDRLRVQTLPVLDLWYVSAGLSFRLRAGEDWIAFFN